MWATLNETLLDEANLDAMQIEYGASDRATKALHLSWSIVAKRCWTMSKHSAPPDANAKLLATGTSEAAEGVRATAAALLKSHHKNVLSLENAAASGVQDAKSLWKDCLFVQMQPVRLMWEFYRRDKYSTQSPLGRHLMNGMLGIMADNKIAEDIHADLRLAAKGNSNLKLARANIQDIINNSTVIQDRGMPHDCQVTEDCAPLCPGMMESFCYLVTLVAILVFHEKCCINADCSATSS